MNKFILLFAAFVAVAGAACAPEISVNAISSVIIGGTPKVENAKAKLIPGAGQTGVTVTESQINTGEAVSRLIFLDKDVGWFVGSKEELYGTDDGGKSWTKLPVQIEKKAYIRQVYFINRTTGWLTIQRMGDINENDTKAWLLKTIDGGKSWRTLAVQPLTEFDEIKFLDEKNGWLIGATSARENVYDTTQFLRKTTDGGATWVEVGNDFFEKNGFTDARAAVTGLIVESPEKLKVSVRSGKLFETENGGKTWRQFGPEFDFPAQTLPDNFGKLGNSNRLRMARGTWSIEGIYSYFATENNGDWTVRWLEEPVCIYDIQYLSDKEMLAVGRFGENIYRKDQKLYGVVLYSADGGENWNIVYRSEKSPGIGALSKIGDKEFLALGEKNLLLDIKITK